ncbi:hypothetical protein DEO72_LG10g592 [Vigna unguiculata]|uniref:Uncharacterized protein n=1 Tax=Vigna unguiculata TaxID=3917 RepID=A0A4D6N6D0_VIGUN|nr:hypothetical protein DEO72_LG10g592 [Vigna unguiculata]
MTSSWRTGLASLSASISATTTPPSRCRPTTTTGATSVASCRLRLVQKLAHDSCNAFAKVKLKSSIMRMVSGKRYYGEYCDVM